MLHVAVDIGDTNARVAVLHGGVAEVVANEHGDRETPCALVFHSRETLVGAPAIAESVRSPDKLISHLQELISCGCGETGSDEGLRNWLTLARWNDDHRSFVIELEVPADDVDDGSDATVSRRLSLSPAQILAELLAPLRDIAKSFANVRQIHHVTVCSSPHWSAAHLQVICEAFQLADFGQVEFSHAPLMSLHAALAFSPIDDGHVLVVDLGGSSTQLSLIEKGSVSKCLHTSRSSEVSGRAVDVLLAEYCVQQFSKQHRGKTVERKSRSWRKMLLDCERCKKTLSTSAETTLEFENIADGIDFSLALTRARLLYLCSDLMHRLTRQCGEFLAQHRVDASSLKAVIPVGGMANMPMVRDALQAQFPKIVIVPTSPSEACVRGCVMSTAKVVSPHSETDLVERTAKRSLGVRTEGGVMHVLVPKGATLPIKIVHHFSTSADSQRNVSIEVFEGEHVLVRDCFFLARLILSHLPESKRGSLKITVTMECNVDGAVKVTVAEARSRAEETVTITGERDEVVPDDADEESLAVYGELPDMKMRALVEAQQKLVAYAYGIRNAAEDKRLKTIFSVSALKQLREQSAQTISWLAACPQLSAFSGGGSDEDALPNVQAYVDELARLKLHCDAIIQSGITNVAGIGQAGIGRFPGGNGEFPGDGGLPGISPEMDSNFMETVPCSDWLWNHM